MRRYAEKRAVFLFSAVCLAMIVGCEEGKRGSHDHPELTTGKQLFEYHCAACHRTTGVGNFLKGVPPNKYTALHITQIVHQIKGAEEDRMPDFSDMPAEEASKIAAYLKTIRDAELEKKPEEEPEEKPK